MANIISNDAVNESHYFSMSNGLTDVLIDVICLAGSDIAEEAFQKELMIWFAQRDWRIMGLGITGFDISDIIWDSEIFDKQKVFILEVIQKALIRKNWEVLEYEPKEEWIFPKLNQFTKMIDDFKKEHIKNEQQTQVIPFDVIYTKCSKHQIFLHVGGCRLCDN